MTRNHSFVLITALASALSLESIARAEVRVFQVQQPPTTLERPSGSSNPLTGFFGFLGRAPGDSAKNVVYRFIADNRLTFGIEKPGEDTLPLKNAQKTERGMNLRFAQVVNGIAVSGAELIAVFNADGELEAINSSLKAITTSSVAPELTREQALQIAARELKFENVELGEDSKDGLMIATSPEGAVLVWQLSIREGADGSRPTQVQVAASGARKGQIIRSIALGERISGDITIYDASVTLIIPNPLYKGLKVLKNGKRRGTGLVRKVTVAKEAHQSLLQATDYFMSTFKRDSFDGNGASLVASVNVGKRFSSILDPLGMRQNVAWVGPWKMFTFGAGGNLLGNFTKALDVVAHEFTHAVVGSTANLEYSAQPGALNEHLADLFGAAAERHHQNPENPFIIGEKCLRGALRNPVAGSGGLRDMLNPHKSLNIGLALGRADADAYGQPAHMLEIPEELGDGCAPSGDKNDSCGVHILNGIPNRAMSLAIVNAGWDRITKLAYDVMATRLLSTSDFANYRDQLLDECKATAPATTCNAIRKGFENVGL